LLKVHIDVLALARPERHGVERQVLLLDGLSCR